ncbi:STAG-domain-containing protein [Dothidotthia symphoricarpi CBS 119687]|uniref:STAG-domain-containing protein n=1 Tax=Dothidotthia symphoricarpi CBS 119687 TaxID=1392245 RepID=A0A6A6A5N8_9PLEO|nr:STAG-domain-containing protein [Dothidotthia symphoricarpi CBS 119687]KAF2126424.1 STAG-domain-containing protein [Dothidotthia symphoricarpi CBS 119687]
MSSADVASDGEIASSTARRKSGRVSKKPQKYAPGSSPGASTKRKRGDDDDSGVDANEALSEEEDEESSEGEPDEEELRERRRKQKSKARAKKPAPKKAKTNGKTVSLAIRPATSVSKKATKKPRKAAVRKSTLAEDAPGGLYADVFASGDRLEDVAARWVVRFNEHEGLAVAEIVNLVLRAAGCGIQIDEDDIADPDNSHNRVAEIQEEFQAQEVTDYPLIAKAKDGGGQAFRKALHGFFYTLIQTVAQSGLMYENTILIETFEVWIGSMSSTGNRPFRHTSTVASLAIITSLAQVAADIVENTAKKIRQSESESNKSRVNKTRVSAANQEVEQYNQKLELVDTYLNEWFEMVYIHRYRDVDPKIRVDCVVALVDWIIIYQDKFFDGSHLRYLGWVLSDPNPPTRVEVLHQLTRLFRDTDKLAGLKTFTERFRPRIVEIATRDAENNVRAAAVDLLDVLREAGFLEPDDIDSVGKLIFDSDAKVRKSVVGFFAENVNAAYEATVEDMGGEEALNEALAPPDEDDEEYQNPRLEWLKLKCLVEQLLSYDEEDSELPSQIERISPSGAELGLVAAGIESRFSLAAQALYDAIPEIRSWEVLAGYLLYDHSQTVQNGAGDDPETMLRQNCQLEEKHETALLDILNAVVRIRLQRLAEAQNDKKKTKAQRESNQEDQAEMARKLSTFIPQLLKKFGALPEAAALCLRLERELNLDVFQELRQNAALTALLDDINKQFLTHHNERVLSEAIGSILHAQGNDELKEMIGLKIQALWDDLINTFDALRRGKDFTQRGNLEQNIVVGVSNVVLKMAQLAKASDASVLDHVYAPANSRSKSKKAALDTPPIASLLDILDRGVLVDRLDAELQEPEDTLVRHAMSLMLVYFMWKCRSCGIHIEEGTTIPDEELTAIAERRDACITALMRIMQTRKGADDVRLDAANLLLDIYNMFRSLKAKKSQITRTPKKTQGRASIDASDDWESLCQDIDDDTAKLLTQILSATETNLAKLAGKRLEEPDVDDDPIDPDDEPESDDDDDVDQTDRQLRTLLAEERLCHFGARIVQAVQVGSLDSNGGDAVRTRLERNKTKLTPTWREVVNHLDAVKQGKKKVAAAKARDEKKEKSKAIVIEDDSEEEEQEEEEQHDEIEDEEMADADAEEQVNGAEERDVDAIEDDERVDGESIVGD